MSFLLCHDCYTWVEPAEDRCPECQFVMDLSEADPPAEVLREVIGEPTCRLGFVRIPRPMLPEWGTLYATTQGLFFLPENSERLFWKRPFWKLFWPFSGRTSFKEDADDSLCDRADLNLAALLMENPGTLFIPKSQIRSITQRRTRWTLERTHGGRVLLSPLDRRGRFHRNFRALLETPLWRIVPHSSPAGIWSFSRKAVSQS